MFIFKYAQGEIAAIVNPPHGNVNAPSATGKVKGFPAGALLQAVLLNNFLHAGIKAAFRAGLVRMHGFRACARLARRRAPWPGGNTQATWKSRRGRRRRLALAAAREGMENMFGDISLSTQMGIWGFIIGLATGFVVHRTNFCAMGAVSDIVSFSDWRRMRAWILAMAVAMLGAQTLHLLGYVDLTRSIYLNGNLPLSLSGVIIGGLVFGFGMVLAGGCPGRNLMRVGNGDLKAMLVMFVLAWAANLSMKGILAFPRLWVGGAVSLDLKSLGLPDQGLATILGKLTGADGPALHTVVMLAFAGALALFAFKDKSFRNSPRHIAAGVFLGLLVTAAWFITGYLGYDEFADQPVQITGLTFIAPAADALKYWMFWTGDTITFAIATVTGVVIGSFISSKLNRTFHLSTFVDTPDTVRNIVGAVLMGFGGILALGCTFGQGITGMSTLAIGSIIATISIIAGGVAGVKYMERVLDI